MVTGCCLCGRIGWEVESKLELMSHCHCSVCRRTHGTSFATYAAAAADGFRWTSGRDEIARYESSPGFWRPFCPHCGSTVAGEPHENGQIFMPVGCLDGDPGARPLAHIFVASKAPWYEIADELPRFDAYPPGVPTPEVPPREASPPRAGALRGGCLCGAVRYEIEGQPVRMHNCHCSRCQKARAAAHATNAFVALESFRFTSGEDRLSAYKVPEAERYTQTFCSTCGSKAPRVSPELKMAVTPIGSLDDDPGPRPQSHIFAPFAAPWFTIADDLPQYDGYPT